MRVTRILCPDCGTSLPAHIAYAPGQMVDCPHCRLLFVVTSHDIANFDERPVITDVHESDLKYDYSGSIAATEARRRRIKRRENAHTERRRWQVGVAELSAGLIVGFGLLVLAGTIIGIILSSRDRSAVTPPPAPPPPAVAEPTPDTPPTAPQEPEKEPPVIDGDRRDTWSEKLSDFPCANDQIRRKFA